MSFTFSFAFHLSYFLSHLWGLLWQPLCLLGFLFILFGSLSPVQCYESLPIVLQALCLPDLMLWIYSSLPLYNHKAFDLMFSSHRVRLWWWTGRSGVLQSMGSQRVRHDGATELTELADWAIGSQIIGHNWSSLAYTNRERLGSKEKDQGNVFEVN